MISAVILAAGLSSRMGSFKPLLPYGNRTVIEHIISVLHQLGLGEILVVSGHNRKALNAQLQNSGAISVHNANYRKGEMLSSIQTGLRSARPSARAALIVLGDQPALEPSVVQDLIEAFHRNKGGVIIPSYNMRRGHPILIGRDHWSGILNLNLNQSMRDFLKNDKIIYHINVYHGSVLRDMDTQADYERELILLEKSISEDQ